MVQPAERSALLQAATLLYVHVVLCSAAGASGSLPVFPSMVFMENNTADGPRREDLNYTLQQEHARQVAIASHYQLVIMGWGEDQVPGQRGGEEEKLASILQRIKRASPTTKTFAYCGQFEGIQAMYTLQNKILQDASFSGYWVKDDDGKRIGGDTPNGAMWDFRNASARTYLATQVAGYFARADGVDGVFFDEGDSFACHYSCTQHNTCKTMPNAVEWQRGAIEAWKLAAEEMARAGKHAIISSQNSFNASTPYLMKEPKNGCPVSEDEAFAVLNSSALARKGWMRFYEYFAHPGDQHSAAENALYCANTIKNAAREASLGVPFVAAASDYPWGAAPSPAPGPHQPPLLPCSHFKSAATCPPRCVFDSGTCDPLPPPPPGTKECCAAACSNPSSQWNWADPAQGSEILQRSGSPLRAGTWPNCGISELANGTEIETGSGSKSICPALRFKLTEEGRVQVLNTESPVVQYCLAIPPHASAKLFECSSGAQAADEQRFVWKADSSGNGTLALAAGQFRAGQCLSLVDSASTHIRKQSETERKPERKRDTGTVSLEFSLAMFLIAREAQANGPAGIRSHFEYNHDGWSAWPRWSDDDTSWEEVKQLYSRVAAAGAPLGDYVESAGMVFTRQYERLTVSVDCIKRVSNYTWA